MPGGTFSRRNKKVSFTAWNIRGVSDKVIGDKLQNDCFISNIKNNDIIVLTETWTRTDVQVSGFKSFVSKLNNCSSNGRLSGGVCLLVKEKFYHGITVVKTTTNFVWCRLESSCVALIFPLIFLKN